MSGEIRVFEGRLLAATMMEEHDLLVPPEAESSDEPDWPDLAKCHRLSAMVPEGWRVRVTVEVLDV